MKKLYTACLTFTAVFMFALCVFTVLFFPFGARENAETICAENYTQRANAIQFGGLSSSVTFSRDEKREASVVFTSASHTKSNSVLYDTLLDGLRNSSDKISFENLGVQITKEQLNAEFTSVINSNPELFYVKAEYTYYTSGGKILYVVPKYTATGNELKAQKKEYESLVAEILKEVNTSWSDLEKVLFVHDYIVKNFRYDPDYAISEKDTVYDTYLFLKTKEGVCQAYTLLAIELFNRLDINSGAVVSAGMNHVWNCVQIDGKWYHLDITWDDPLVSGKLDRFDDVFYSNFLCGNAAIEATGHYGWEAKVTFDDGYDNFFVKKLGTGIDIAPLGKDWYILAKSTEANINGLVLGKIDFKNNTYNRLAFLPVVWNVWENVTSYYLDTYSGIGSYADTLVISTDDTLYAYDTTTARFIELGEYTYSYGYIYGMRINGANATFRVAKSPVFSSNDRYITVSLSDIKFKVEISYENPAGEKLSDPYIAEHGWGTEFSVNSPLLEGYTVKEANVSGKVPIGGISRKVIYEKYRKFTVNYLYENGQKAYESYVNESASVGEKYSVKSPDIAGYIPDKKTVELVMTDNDVEINVIYSPTLYSIKINYVYENGTSVAASYELTDLVYMAEYSVESPKIKGYTADRLVIEGSITENIEINVTYTPITCKITVEYAYLGGTFIDSEVCQIPFGTTYEIKSPKIQGYVPDIDVITGTADDENIAYKVVYSVKKYTLTIKYVHINGEQIFTPHIIENMDYMAQYSVVSPNFENYIPTVKTVSGEIIEDTEITVIYHLEKYTVIFMSEGREFYSAELDYGSVIELPKNIPVKAPSVQYYYVFLGWDGYSENITVAGEMIFNASFEENVRSYTVIFRNYDGTILYTDEVEYGALAEYKGETPVHDHEDGKTCVFIGWDKDTEFISEDTEFTAVFSDGKPIYTVSFYDWDGTLISTQSVYHGQNATLPEPPKRASDNTYSYVFDSWDGTYKKVKSDSVVTAKYKSEYVEYHIVLKNYDGSVLEELVLHYGDSINPTKTPIREGTEFYEYIFSTWSPALPEKVTQNAEFTAQFTEKYRFDYSSQDLIDAVSKIGEAKTLEERFRVISEAYRISESTYLKDPDVADALEILENEMKKYNSEAQKVNDGFVKAIEVTSAVGSFNVTCFAFFALLWTALKKLVGRV